MGSKSEFGSVRKRSNGRYDVRYRGGDGERYSGGRSFRTDGEAKKWLKRVEATIIAGTWVSPRAAAEEKRRAITLKAFATSWLKTRMVAGKPLSPRTVTHYQETLDKYILPTFGSIAVSSITRADVKAWHDQLLPDAPTQRTHAYGLFRGMMNTAVEQELTPTNPVLIRGAATPKRASNTVPATIAELSAITAAMPKSTALTVILGAWTTLRVGEVLALRRRDVHVAADGAVTIAVTEQMNRVRGGAKRMETKTAATVRTLAVPPHVAQRVIDHLAEHVTDVPDAPLFPSPRDPMKPLSRTALMERSYYPARKAAGREDLRFHDLRHTGATLAAEAGASPKEIQRRLGHASVTTALRVYTHATERRDADIAAKMSQLAG